MPGGFGNSGICQHKKGSAIINTRCIAGGNRSVLLESGPHFGQRLGGCCRFDMLIGINCDFAFTRLFDDRHNLLFEAPGLDSGCCASVRLGRQFILLFAGYVPFDRQILGSNSHVPHPERIGQRGNHGVDHRGIAHTGAAAHGGGQIPATAHHLNPTANAVITVTQQNILGCSDDAL